MREEKHMQNSEKKNPSLPPLTKINYKWSET